MPRLPFALLPLLSQLATAADFTVTRTDDPFPDGCKPADCSLREAVNDAQAADGPDRVLLPAGTFVLDYDAALDTDAGETGPLQLVTPIEIVGSGRSTTVLTPSPTMPTVIAVSMNMAASTATLTDLTIANYTAPGNGLFGTVLVGDAGSLVVRRVGMRDNTAGVPGIVAFGALDIADSVFERNTTLNPATGAVVYTRRAPVTITDTQFIDNTAGVATLGIDLPGAATLDLRGNTFRGNLVAEGPGAVWIQFAAGLVQVDLADSVFEDNRSAGSGGAVLIEPAINVAPTARLQVGADGARFTGNRADGSCGALSLATDSDLLVKPKLSMDLARFDGNTAGSFGGALCTAADTVITRSTFSGNIAEAQGGAIVAGGDTLVIERSTLSGNTAGSMGGAVFSYSRLTLDHSTVHGNSAGTDGGALMLTNPGESRIVRSTITGNTAATASVLRYVVNPQNPGTLRLSGSILHGSCTTNDADAIGPTAYTIESPGNTCHLSSGIGSFNQRNVSVASLALGPLADNGGPTLTRMPADDSVARDPDGLLSGQPCPRIDQRGYTSSDTRCDIGAVEVAGVPAEPLPVEVFADGFE